MIKNKRWLKDEKLVLRRLSSLVDELEEIENTEKPVIPQLEKLNKQHVIKNVIRRLDASNEFDEAVNNALKEGFSLINQVEVIRPFTSDKHTMLIARLEKWVEVE